MRQALRVIAELLTGTTTDPVSLPWWNLQYQHTQAIRSLLMERYSPASSNKMLAALRGVLRESWRLGFMDAEAFHRAIDIKTVAGTTVPPGRSVGSGEINALVESCFSDPTPAGIRDAAILALLYAAGLRRSEVVALDFADYDTDTGGLKILASKGNKARTVYLGNGAKAAVGGWLAVRGTEVGPLMYRVRKGGKIVAMHLTDQAIWVILEKRFRAAKVKPFTPHDLRRTFARHQLPVGITSYLHLSFQHHIVVPAVAEVIFIDAPTFTIPQIEEVGQGYLPCVWGVVIIVIFIGNPGYGFPVWPWFLERPQMFIKPPERVLNRIV